VWLDLCADLERRAVDRHDGPIALVGYIRGFCERGVCDPTGLSAHRHVSYFVQLSYIHDGDGAVVRIADEGERAILTEGNVMITGPCADVRYDP
jgi:hypothetical protein